MVNKTKGFDYKTHFYMYQNKMHVFYRVSKGVGFIPTELDFVYRKRHYSTMILIENIARCKNILLWNLRIRDWMALDDQGRKAMFVKLHKELVPYK